MNEVDNMALTRLVWDSTNFQYDEGVWSLETLGASSYIQPISWIQDPVLTNKNIICVSHNGYSSKYFASKLEPTMREMRGKVGLNLITLGQYAIGGRGNINLFGSTWNTSSITINMMTTGICVSESPVINYAFDTTGATWYTIEWKVYRETGPAYKLDLKLYSNTSPPILLGESLNILIYNGEPTYSYWSLSSVDSYSNHNTQLRIDGIRWIIDRAPST